MKVSTHVSETEENIVIVKVFVSVVPKRLPKADNENEPYDFWSDEMKEFLDKYDK